MARTVKCPSCGGELIIKDESRDFMFCEYCGTKVRLDDYQETHRFVDEARIQESKDAKELRIKEMEFEERQQKEDMANTFKVLKWMMILGAACMALLIIGAILETLGIIE